jgi:pimeloyl-ACP methyl ester carboxylesterase
VNETSSAKAQSGLRTFVFVHGAWHGGWCWARVAGKLRAAGHKVFTPTQTGLADRKHLLSKDITVETFTLDVTNLIEAEELSDVVLVGHSFGGVAISGTADIIPQRIKHLIYLDALVIEGGKTPFEGMEADVTERRRLAEETSGGLSLPAPPPSVFGVTEAKDADWLKRQMTPHPFNTCISPLNIKGPVGNNLPRTYIACTNPSFAVLEPTRRWVKAQQGWQWREIPCGHDAMVTAPDELTSLLTAIAA